MKQPLKKSDTGMSSATEEFSEGEPRESSENAENASFENGQGSISGRKSKSDPGSSIKRSPAFKPRVLAVTSDSWALQSLRIRQPLESLTRAGLIRGYTILLNDKLIGPSSFDRYDVVLVQRLANLRIYEAISELAPQLILDIDDLVPATPAYRSAALPEKEDISRLLQSDAASAVIPSVTSERLASLLDKYLTCDISGRTVVTPNSLIFPAAEPAMPQVPSGILWTSSDVAALMDSAPDVLRAIRDFSERYELPVYAAGVFTDEQRGIFKDLVEFGKMDFWQHKAMLASLPTMIAVCPLETVADGQTLDFIAGKSDLKMVEFGGFGHPGVYSDAPPYAESDLQTGVVAENTYEAWSEALEFLYTEGYKKAAVEARRIREKRNADTIARDHWMPLLEKAYLPQSFGTAEFYQVLLKQDLRREAQRQRNLRRRVEDELADLPHAALPEPRVPTFEELLSQAPALVPMRYRMADGLYRRLIRPLPRPLKYLLGRLATKKYRRLES